MYRKKMIIVLAMGLTLFTVACESSSTGDKSETENEVSTPQTSEGHEEVEEPAEMAEVSTNLTKDHAAKILASYLKVKDALVLTDGVGAREEAKVLVAAIGESEDELAKKLHFDATHISGTKDPEHQRDHFFTLSNNVYGMVKATNANDATLYKQFCPMARDNKGAFWLSAEAEVNNPYFGDKMLHCGSVKEEL